MALADDACLLLDSSGRIVSISLAAAALLGCERVTALGNRLLDQVTFVDFHTGEPAPAYATRVPPLLALSADCLARGIVRVNTGAGRRTVDVVSAPVRGGNNRLVGSLSFLSAVSAQGA